MTFWKWKSPDPSNGPLLLNDYALEKVSDFSYFGKTLGNKLNVNGQDSVNVKLYTPAHVFPLQDVSLSLKL